jgi:hypothetical protein
MVQPLPQTDGLRLGESHRHMESKGFGEQFKVAKEGHVLCISCGTESAASLFKVDSQKRVEGVSDPAEESLVLAIHCPACDAKGTLTLAYGPRAGRDEAAVLAALPPVGRG